MKRLFIVITCLVVAITDKCIAQELRFNHILGNKSSSDQFLSMAQDKYGFMWFTRQLGGLQRYDGYELTSYQHDPDNNNSLAANWVECLVIDKDNMFWLGTYGAGLDRFDPATNTFTHFVHNDKDPGSLSHNTVTALYLDRSDNLWVGTLGGLNLLDKKTGKFIQYKSSPADNESLSDNEVRVIYEDRSGMMWIGCGRPFTNLQQKPEDGGLNSLDRTTGKFKRYKHDAGDPASIASNKVRALFEDSKGNFWVGTRDDGLQTLDRKTGRFTHYYYDPLHPEKLSRPRQIIDDGIPVDHIAFITEDPLGNLIIASHFQGLNYYNTATQTTTHYGYLNNSDGVLASLDNATGLNADGLWSVFKSRDGLIWIAAFHSIFNINPYQTYLPYHFVGENKPGVNSFYVEANGKVLWMATDLGLVRKDLVTNRQEIWKHDHGNENSLPHDAVSSVKAGEDGKLWVGTANGLSLFDPATKKFTNWYHNDKDSASLSSNLINFLYLDMEKNLWIGTAGSGVSKLNTKNGIFTNYRNDENNRNSIDNNYITGICEDQQHDIWIATGHGLNSLDRKTGKIGHYFPNSNVLSVYADAAGIVWAAVPNSLYYFDKTHKIFKPFENSNRREELSNVINIIGDRHNNLWLSTPNTIIRINEGWDAIKIYDSTNAVHTNTFAFGDNYVNQNGDIYIGDQQGYYLFNTDSIKERVPAPFIRFTSFKIADTEVKPGKGSALDTSVLDDIEIKLSHTENNFSVEFTALNYEPAGNNKFLYKMENYDNSWRYLGIERKVYFFNMEPGEYVLHIRVVKKDGVFSEREMMIIIAPPWWRTWWAYALLIILFVSAVWAFVAYRSMNLRRANKLLEEKVEKRTHELKEQKEKVESTLSELKSTQSQLIQSEKMASLGELTAGIAHEIQNPLNFVNNFSEINAELIEELKSERAKAKGLPAGQAGERNEQLEDGLLNDIAENEKKINHHGKRADAIVKGMLQHSRSSSAVKEPTDINKLVDEYLRLAYHGLRAKDKSFNATLKTDYDEAIGNINVVPQDIGRAVLNLITNAFYAVAEKGRQTTGGYEPTVTVSTRKINDHVEVSVKDNGIGVPQKIADKIFQPFFTTKPTGQGTGLGLSLSYDIVKAHGGELSVKTSEGGASPDDLAGQGTVFMITLPF